MKKFIVRGDFSIVDFYKTNMDKFAEEFIIFDSPGSSKLENYSYIVSHFSKKVRLKNGVTTLNGNPSEINAEDLIREILNKDRYGDYESGDFFSGGLVGLVSYDYNRYIERLPNIARDDLGLEDLYFVLPQLIVVKDESSNEFHEINNLGKEIGWNLEILGEEPNIENSDIEWHDLENFSSNITEERFKEIVECAKHYIKEGDVFQVNLSQRFSAPINRDESFRLYEILRKINPSPFASYVCLEEFKLISQSPERLIKLHGRTAETRPIAGTRRIKKGDTDNNLKLEKELVLDEKEQAEHVMLVDLERNDLGKVCEFGSVKVDEFMVIERYSHVMHIVSNVVGKLKPDCDGFELLKAMFPGGTITGAPKIRTMEIIEELEPTKRGYYTGSIGYIDFDGNLDFNIIIRSFVQKGEKVYFQVGAGIVYDSIPEREYRETVNKARAMILAYKNLVKN